MSRNFCPAGDESDEWDDGELQLMDDSELIPPEFTFSASTKTSNQNTEFQGSSLIRGDLREAENVRQPGSSPGSASTRRRDDAGAPLSKQDFRLAVSRGNLPEVQSFVERGIDVDTDLQAGWTALMHAASQGHANIVQYLLEKGADPNYNRASYMFTPLIAACSRSHEKSTAACVALLLDKGANVNAHESSHMTSLMFAAKHGHPSVAEQLLQHGARVNREDNRGWTALCFAAELGNIPVVKMLMESGADASKQSGEGTAADIAHGQGHDTVEALIKNGGDLPEGFLPNGFADDVDSPSRQSNRASAIQADDASHGYRKYSDLEMFLHSLDMSHLVPVFQKHVIDFAGLQSLTEPDLEKIGVEQLGCRKKIMHSIHQIHKVKWEKESLRKPSSQILSRAESYTILDNAHQHLNYITSAVKYIHCNWTTHGSLEDRSDDLSNLEKLSEEAGATLKQSRQLFMELHQMKTKINKVTRSTDIVPADLIRDPDDTRGGGAFKYVFAFGLVATVTVSVLWYGGQLKLKTS